MRRFELEKHTDPVTTDLLVDIPHDTLLAMYEMMLRIRRFEEKIAEVYPEQEMKCPVHLSIGQEAAAVGVCTCLLQDDYIFSNHRCHAHYLAKGGDPRRMIAELYGKKTGCAGGKGGSMHFIAESVGMMGTSAIVGASLPMAVGVAWARAMQNSDYIGVSFFGDAGAEQGTFHESLNFAALKRLPLLLVCENNSYAVQTPISKRQAIVDNIFKRGEIYGIPGEQVDGNDVLAVYTATRKAVERCRRGEGPTLLECRTYRWREHVGPNYDYDLGYRTKKEVEEWMERCPVKNWGKRLLQANIATEADLEMIASKIEREVESAFALAKADPVPDEAELFDNVY
ncbi:thiamine pyrophosphate-dependent dehydrogenase E1 component subunit alpha [Chloroflexota bacterium]